MEKSEAATIDINAEESKAESKGKAPLLPTPPPPPPPPPPAVVDQPKYAKGGYKRGVAIFDLILRLSAIASAIGAAVTMATAEQDLPFFNRSFQFQASYDNFTTFTFFVVGMGFVLGYLVLSLPFSIVCVVRPHLKAPRLLLLIFDTAVLVLATAAASAAADLVYLAHNGNSDANWFAICNQFGDFCGQISGAVVAGFVAVVIIAFMVVLSAFALGGN